MAPQCINEIKLYRGNPTLNLDISLIFISQDLVRDSFS